MKRTSVEVRKAILKLLIRYGELSLSQLETKVNTASQTIKNQVQDLKSLGFVVVKHYTSHPKNKKPYTTCRITEKGMTYMKK